jgi:hypothetical protein
MSEETDGALHNEAFAYLRRVKWDIQEGGTPRVLLDEGRGITVPGAITMEMADALGTALVSCAEQARSMAAVYGWLHEGTDLDDTTIGGLISKLTEANQNEELLDALRQLMPGSY